MASYSVNPAGVERVRRMIESRQYVLHRSGLIDCHDRAAEWRHKEVELAAHELLQALDAKPG
jgi:hypothetical protein